MHVPSFEGRYCTHNDIVLSTSEDGRDWTYFKRIPIDPVTSSVDHFIHAVAVDPETSGSSAHIAVVYYFHPEQRCDVKTCELDVGFVSSDDGGSTWDDRQLAGPFKHTWFLPTEAGYMVGDYIGASFVEGKAVVVFPIAPGAGVSSMTQRRATYGWPRRPFQSAALDTGRADGGHQTTHNSPRVSDPGRVVTAGRVKNQPTFRQPHNRLVGPRGLEPRTCGLRVRCSTDTPRATARLALQTGVTTPTPAADAASWRRAS